MNIFNICGVNIFLFLIFSLIFDQTYKVCTKNSKSDGALTVILEFLAGVFILLLIPFFEIKFPTDIKIYILWGISIIFFAITDRINTTVRRGVEASTFNILRQISTVFILIAGILIFKEEVVFKKIIGAILIIFSNILIFYEKDVGEIIDLLEAFPQHLTLNEQAAFAIGYYHQRQYFFKKKEQNTTEEGSASND